MHRYEYKVIPAPGKGLKAKGLKSPEARFAYALETAMNELGAEGWTYLRADILPSEEWRARLEKLIRDCDTLLFAISPSLSPA